MLFHLLVTEPPPDPLLNTSWGEMRYLILRQQNQTVMNHFMKEDNTINALSGDNVTGIHIYINSLE